MSDNPAVAELAVNVPTLPEGEPLQIPGLGTFENGQTYGLTQDEIDGFSTYHTQHLLTYNEVGESVIEVVPGITLADATDTMEGFTFKVLGADPKSQPKPKPKPEEPEGGNE
jgi:hypothetical protein